MPAFVDLYGCRFLRVNICIKFVAYYVAIYEINIVMYWYHSTLSHATNLSLAAAII